MIHALGFSNNPFDPFDPGRLCRGRERWIDPWEPEEAFPGLHRVVVSGASFSDDSASDARRGVPHSGLDVAAVIAALFPRKPMLAFMEDGHPADIPEAAVGVEAYNGYRAGGRSVEVLVRWHRRVSGVREIRDTLDERHGGAEVKGALAADLVRGFAVLAGDEDEVAVLDACYLLCGNSTLDSPPARFQPAALVDVTELVKAVILLHRDKHGPVIGVYSREPLRLEDKLRALCEKEGVLPVPFAIPPMLARWDRALADLRQVWMQTRRDEFPVPPAPEAPGWERRRHRRGRAPVEDLPPAAPSAAEE
jgi:hypothetical protein